MLDTPFLGQLAAAILAVLLANSPAYAASRQLPHDQSASAAVSAPARQAAPEVILLRGGVGGMFSVGMDAIGAKLTAQGVPTTVAGFASWHSIEKKLIKRRQSGTLGRVVLVGHSYGADAITIMADELSRAGVAVDLLVSIVATSPRPLSGNVRNAVSYYYSQKGWGRLLTPSSRFKGRLDNRDIADRVGVTHFNIEKQAAVQDEIVSIVMGAVGR